MKRIGLIACSCSKLGEFEPERKFKAKEIYTGNTFRISKNIGLQRFNCEDWHILSAKYNLLDKDKEISYYNVWFHDTNVAYTKEWAHSVITKLNEKYDLKNDVFYIFGGSDYYRALLPYLHCFVFGYKNSNTIDLDNMTEYVFGTKAHGGKKND